MIDYDALREALRDECFAALEYDLQMEREHRYPLGDMDSVIGR